MKAIAVFVICAFVGLMVLGAGCTQPATGPQTSAQTPTPTTSPAEPTGQQTVTTPAVTPTLGYIAGPIPSQYEVIVEVDRNRVATNPLLTATFRGGKGINFISTMEVVVSRSDGQVISKIQEKPQVNSKVEIMGTQGTDRVEIFVTLVNGERYRIYDQSLAFRSYN